MQEYTTIICSICEIINVKTSTNVTYIHNHQHEHKAVIPLETFHFFTLTIHKLLERYAMCFT